MCLLWQKLYTCGCVSHLHRDRCPPCLRSTSTDDCDNTEKEETPRKSYFKCYTCLVAEDRQEKRQAQEAAVTAMAQCRQEDEQRKREAEKRRLAQSRLDAQRRAEREREEELRRQRDLKAEQERKRREGGTWVDAATKKGRRRNGGTSQSTLPLRPAQAPAPLATSFSGGVFSPLNHQLSTYPTINHGTSESHGSKATAEPNTITGFPSMGTGAVMTVTGSTLALKENGPSLNIDHSNVISKPRIDPGGRAGRWGPSSSNSSARK